MDLLERLKIGPLLCDGAMGTQLIARGLQPGEPPELWNVDRTDDVEDIHRAYRDAGCDIITTNTFGGSIPALTRHGLADREAELNGLGVRLARRAVGGSCHLLGDIGPLTGYLPPDQAGNEQQVYRLFRTHVMSLKRGGADGICIETIGDVAQMRLAVRAAKGVSYWPVIASYAFAAASDGVFKTLSGESVESAIKTAIDAGADVVGANCGMGLLLKDYVSLAEQIKKIARKFPVFIKPNAGSAASGDTPAATPAELAAIVRPLLDAGVQIIGGCCGTTPAHLAAMAAAMP